MYRQPVKYYYYMCNSKYKTSEAENEYPIKRLPSELLENLVRDQMKKIFVSEDILKLLSEKVKLPQSVLLDIFHESFWNNVNTAEFTRLANLLVETVTVNQTHIDVEIKQTRLKSVESDLKKRCQC